MAKRHEPTEKQRGHVEVMAGMGIPHEEIARYIGITLKTLYRHYRHELDIGGTKATFEVARTLYNKATGGDTTAAIFWLKARAGWSERSQVALTDKDGEPLKLGISAVLSDDEKPAEAKR